ncbi:Uncharacterised protein [uncultured Clostridium sp.]|uniref:hypothetical protein n=1 Tax=uncultured Clostridium sp. TaxID=59620 RepID=UPI0008220271|nr:hypothetical protein [uncultured Clostridium sp.]SCK04727.1 Uncharacterised protein [uncultured Clostridium sp.]
MLDKNTSELINLFLKSKDNMNKESLNENEEIQKLISCGILNDIILSKKIFKRNYMIGEFLDTYFSISLSNYILSSRTMICGKITKYIYSIDDKDELINFLNSLYSILLKIESNKNIFDKDIYEVIMGIKL